MAGDLREDEVEMLRSMFDEHELAFPEYPEELFRFALQLQADVEEEQISVELSCVLPEGYPDVAPIVAIGCDRMNRNQREKCIEDLSAALNELASDEMRVLPAIDWIRDHLGDYLSQATPAVKKDASSGNTGPKPVKGFMREWCSFVSLYKDSYISGPNRFELMMSLARERGLNVTGMGISGKPGGLVAEGEENDLVEFMILMRTEFFETLNPRGRKLTTRLQERWPLDDEQDRFEAAEVLNRIRKDAYKSVARAEGKKLKPGEKERLEKQEADDRARLDTWRAANSNREMLDAEVDKLMAAGPPATCSMKGIYNKCGCEDPPTLEEVNGRRLFKDFTIFQGKEGYEAAYQEAAKTFKELGRMDGFDAMFTYRFS